MMTSDAIALIRDAVPSGPSIWADFGAGTGTFTHALADILGAGSRIYAVDRDRRALQAIARWANEVAAEVVLVVADIAAPLGLPSLATQQLDGILLANTLHFIEDAAGVLSRLAQRLRLGGRVVLVEYDRRRASRWVPYPISPAELPALAASAGLSPPVITARQPSAFGGELYVAVAEKPGNRSPD